MDHEIKDFIGASATMAADKAADAAIDKVFDRYGLEAEHMVFIKESYDRNIQISSIVRKTIIGAIIVALIGWGAAGFIVDVATKVKDLTGS